MTDGASTDGDPENIATAIRQISTSDGECLLFNIHVSTQQGETIQFPNSDSGLADNYAKLLFRMLSVLPAHVSKLAADKGYRMAENAHGFMFNADPKDIANFFDIGTRPRLRPRDKTFLTLVAHQAAISARMLTGRTCAIALE